MSACFTCKQVEARVSSAVFLHDQSILNDMRYPWGCTQNRRPTNYVANCNRVRHQVILFGSRFLAKRMWSIFSPLDVQVQKRLTVEDQRLLQANMLVGIAPELIGDTPEEVRDISKGMGRRFVVQSIVR